jgi:ABC-type nitrate/sulfonate/bicarbonate transport system ATPase subunit
MKLSIRSLCKNYEAKKPGRKVTEFKRKIIPALINCSLEIEDRSFTVIAGRSGCGKTTLLKTIAGLEQADSGTVDFFTAKKPDDENLSDFSAHPKIGFMFQDPRLLPWLTVEQNLELAFSRPGDSHEKKAMRNEIQKVLEMTGLADRASSLPGELSGGMAQRCALARCLCRNPELLLLDEPLSSLDAFTRVKLREELEKLWQRLGITVILVTHDIEEAVFFGENVFLMNDGTIESKISISLHRPRDCRTAEFQEYCKRIEDTVCKT